MPNAPVVATTITVDIVDSESHDVDFVALYIDLLRLYINQFFSVIYDLTQIYKTVSSKATIRTSIRGFDVSSQGKRECIKFAIDCVLCPIYNNESN